MLRSEVTKRLEAIRIATAGERVNAKEYYKAIFWLDGQRFYLSAEQCNELNELKEATKPRLIAQEGRALTPREFVPDEEMDETYFLDESDSGH
jgi:predicted alpha/beta superfamily hydrolase